MKFILLLQECLFPVASKIQIVDVEIWSDR